VLKACGLTYIPDRRTCDRRLSTVSVDVKERVVALAALFVKERSVDPYIVSVDSTLLKAKGHVWHKSSMIKGVIPRQTSVLIYQIMIYYYNCKTGNKQPNAIKYMLGS
jgi:hypothetical protein